MAQSVKKRRNTYLLGAILVFAFLFSYYFLGYIPSRERLINDRGIRLMNQMAKSSQERLEHYKKSVNLFGCEYYGQGLLNNRGANISSLDLINRFFDVEMDCGIVEDSIYSIYYRELDNGGEGNDSTLDVVIEKLKKALNTDATVEIFEQKDSSKYLFLGDIKGDPSYVAFGLTPENLLANAERLDFFDDVILTRIEDGLVIDESQLNFQYFNYEPSKEEEIEISDEDLAKVAQDQKEEIKKRDNTYHIPNVDIVEQKIAGRKYFCFSRLIELNGTNYYLTGLIDEDKYYSGVRQVSIWTVLVAILVMLFLVQFMPLLKPFILSKKERLQGRDITWSAVSLVFGTAIVTLLIIGIDTFAIEEIDLIDQKLKVHAKNTNADFQRELDSTIVTIRKSLSFYEDNKKTTLDSVKRASFAYSVPAKMKFLAIDNNGRADFFKFNEENHVQILNRDLDLSHREYVKNLKGDVPTGAWLRNNNTGHFQDSTLYRCDTIWADSEDSIAAQNGIANSDTAMHIDSLYCCEPTYYFIESLLTLSNGNYETVVAIKDNEKQIHASVSPFVSVNKRYLEPGYSFSIIGRDGHIHYDSDSTRIGTENFLAEADNNSELLSLLTNRGQANQPLKFSLNEYRIYVEPLENTPWFVVTKYNIRKSRLNVAQAMIITFQVVLFVLIYLFLLHWLHKLPYVLNNRLNLKDFSYLFLSPVNASPRLYWFLAAVNTMFTLLLVGVYANNEINLQLNISIYLGLLTQAILFNYSLLKRYSFFYTRGEMKEILGLNPFEWSLNIFWIFWLVMTFHGMPELGWFKFLVSIQITIALVYAYFKIKVPFKGYFVPEQKTEQKHFTGFYSHTFSWVFMLGIVSCFMFFKPIYNQIHIKRAFANWIEEYDYRNDNNLPNNNKVDLFVADDTPQDTIKHVESSSAFLDAIAMYFEEDAKVLYGQQDNSKAVSLVVTEARDSIEGLPFFNVAMSKTTHRVNQVPMSDNRIVAFALPSLDHSTKPQQTIIFWGIIVFLISILFISIVQLTQKFFYLNVLRRLRILAKAQTNPLQVGSLHKDQSLIMLIGPPSSGRNRVAKSWFAPKAAIYYIDFSNELDGESTKLDTPDEKGNNVMSRPIIINNFDHRSDDDSLNGAKLNFMEKLLRYRNENQIKERIVLITHYGTDQFMQLYQAKIDALKAAKTDSETIVKLVDGMKRWQALLYEFVNETVQLVHKPSEDFIENELNIGYLLPRFIPQIRAYSDLLKQHSPDIIDADLHQKVINAIIKAAQNYYFAVWNACTPSERLFMFDLAEDGLVNTKNETLMSDLVEKGLVQTEPTLRLFNRSFSQFVLENIPEEEGAQLEKLAKSEGMWGTYQVIVGLMVFAILIFLSFAEKEVMARILGMITFAGAVIPKLIDFVSKMGGPKAWFTKST